MAHSEARNQGLISRLRYQGMHTKYYNIGITLLAAAIIAAAAHVEVPLGPVPVTLQSFAVLFIAMTMGWRIGVSATVSYLLAGCLGLPVFAGAPTGFAYLLGPTGGYLVAFPVMSFLAGWAAQRGAAQHWYTSLAVALLGVFGILFIGMLGLSVTIGLHKAYLVGAAPFLLAELCKAIMLAIIVPRFWRAS
jgi:biotin transport system substrate-specific component